MTSFEPAPDEVGERIDSVLARRWGRPRAQAQAAVKDGSVTVSGTPVRPSYRLAAGDVVVGAPPAIASAPPEAEDIAIRVVYSDPYVLVVSKPPGLVTHPAGGHESGTLVNALLGLGGPLAGEGSERPGIVHRLDKDTSGLLLVARDDATHGSLTAALKRREIGRSYVALVRGRPGAATGTIDAPIARHPVARRRMAVSAGGRPAVTHYRVLGSSERTSFLEVRLETGRTHQIRVHLAHLGHPVLGDGTYGGRSELAAGLGLERPFLHAARLSFTHPATGKAVEVTDQLPDDLVAALERAGLASALPMDLR
ncbi:MAG: RluA family pseudouridine synthase [Actinomycetota bacterium]